jgi:hypothetical protein
VASCSRAGTRGTGRTAGCRAHPDTGCTLCDLHEGITLLVALFDRIRPEVPGPLLADCAAKAAVEALRRGVATDYPALVEQSRRMTGTAQTHGAH